MGVRLIWPKTAGHSAQSGQICSQTTHHEMGKCAERAFKKNLLKPKQPLAPRADGADGLLEHSPSGRSLFSRRPALQKTALVFLGGVPLI